MYMILAHHFVCSSPLGSTAGSDPTSINSLFLNVFGLWGKTGINCFLMITGYFMCKSSISIKKFLKLMLQVYFYNIIIYGLFLATGYETVTPTRLIQLLMPVWGFEINFVSCFIGFWLTIPFLNILVNNMTKKQHQLLLLLLFGMYTILGSIPGFKVAMNYVTWFAVIYFLAAYIRLYPSPVFQKKGLWVLITIATFTIASLSILVLQYKAGAGPYFVSDSNKIFAVLVAVSSFLWFKNMNIKYSKLINLLGASTFGVLLIHTNSSAMRQWLWNDVCNCSQLAILPITELILKCILLTITIFCICSLIDIIRIKFFETPFFQWYDKKPRFQKLTSFLSK